MTSVFFSIMFLFGGMVLSANAQMMNNGISNANNDRQVVAEHALKEEKEGKELWNKFQAGEFKCEDLSDDNFGALGEYFMGIMMSDAHASINFMMIQDHGQDEEEQMHIAMGKRFSGCDTEASYGTGGWTLMPTQMMGGGFDHVNGSWSFLRMFSAAGALGIILFIIWILWWFFVAGILLFLIKWLLDKFKENRRSSIDILKERYAKGEIDKKEFEEKKKDLE